MNLNTLTPYFKVIADAQSRALDGTCYVIRGLAPTANGSGLRVDVAAGDSVENGTPHLNYAGGNVICTAASSAASLLARRDIVYRSSAGTLTVLAGTAAVVTSTTPVPPALPASATLIAVVFIAPGQTTLVATDVEDCRQVRVNDVMSANVKVFGATGNGTTDDTAAVAAAIASLPTGGGTVFFPAGTYRVTGLTIGTGVRLIGSGTRVTFLVGTSAGTPVIATTSGGGGAQEVAFMQVVPNAATTIGVNVTGADHSYIHDCYFLGAMAGAIQIDSNNVAGAGVGHRVIGNQIDCSTTASSFGIKHTNTQGAPTTSNTACKFEDNHIIADAPVVYVTAVSHGANAYTNNLFQSRTATVGVAIQHTATTNADMVQGNYFDHFASAIDLPAGSGLTSAHQWLSNHDDNNTVLINNHNAALGGIVKISEVGIMQAGIGARTAGDITTASGAFADATDVTVTLTLGTGSKGRVYVSVTGTHKNDGANTNLFDLLIDGVLVKRHDAGPLVAATDTQLSFDHIATGLASGAHIFKLQWTRTAGTATLYGGTTGSKTTSIVAFELP